jgi:cullin 1
MERVVQSLVALGIDEGDTNRTNLDVYKQHFEDPFLASTEGYYKAESETFIAENSVMDYMTKAEARLKEEEDRIDMYLHASSRKTVRCLPASGVY